MTGECGNGDSGMSDRDESQPEQAPTQTRRSLLRKLAYSTPAIVALSVGGRQAAAQPPPLPPGLNPPASPFSA
jgi:hypothetical protein